MVAIMGIQERKDSVTENYSESLQNDEMEDILFSRYEVA